MKREIIRRYESGLQIYVAKENGHAEFVLQHPDFALGYNKIETINLILDIMESMNLTTADL